MNLTHREKEAFFRGRAAGILQSECPIPETPEEIDRLIFQLGVMWTKIVGCRSKTGGLFFVKVSVFSEKYLAEAIRRLPELLDEVSEVTPLQLEKFDDSPLENLAGYFALGAGIVNDADLAEWHSGLTAADVQRGFEFRYEPEPADDPAAPEQKMAISDRIAQGELPDISRRECEHLTRRAADAMLRITSAADTVPETVTALIRGYDRLTSGEKVRFRELIAGTRH